ncbi:MAG: hypothetical protein JWO06_3357 [Bacteroidota bacterium]|nr:hypothetical protein [Bacteroidota bacterium]
MQNETQKIFALRLRSGDDLKLSIIDFVKQNKLKAGYIITCVGSLQKANLRLANKNEATAFKGKFEIISLVGTLSPGGVHLHLGIAHSNGKSIGGHLMDGCIIYTTAEIVIGEALQLQFARNKDANTGYRELVVKGRE